MQRSRNYQKKILIRCHYQKIEVNFLFEDLSAFIDQNLSESDVVKTNRMMHGVPSSAIMRKSVVMGTVWVFKPTEDYGFDKLCISRMVERFGKDDGNWEHIELLLFEVSNAYDI